MLYIPDRLATKGLAMTTLKLTLPDRLAREAESAGLLKPAVIERLIRAEIRRRRVKQMFVAADRPAAALGSRARNRSARGARQEACECASSLIPTRSSLACCGKVHRAACWMPRVRRRDVSVKRLYRETSLPSSPNIS